MKTTKKNTEAVYNALLKYIGVSDADILFYWYDNNSELVIDPIIRIHKASPIAGKICTSCFTFPYLASCIKKKLKKKRLDLSGYLSLEDLAKILDMDFIDVKLRFNRWMIDKLKHYDLCVMNDDLLSIDHQVEKVDALETIMIKSDLMM